MYRIRDGELGGEAILSLRPSPSHDLDRSGSILSPERYPEAVGVHFVSRFEILSGAYLTL